MPSKDYDASAYWDRRLEKTWSLRGVGLKGYSLGYNRWLYRVRHHVFQRAIRAMDIDPRGADVLDIGPGVGFYTRRWLRMGANVTGLDIADSAVRRLRARFPDARFHTGDISAAELPVPGPFDIVDAFDVLFHIVDDAAYDRAIQNIHRLLRPGGYFLFTDTWARRRTTPMKHYVRRSAAEIQGTLTAAGFDIISRRPAFFCMLTPFDAGPTVRRWWRRCNPLMRSERTGALVGGLLYGPELALTRLAGWTPTIEIALCRRRAA